jgi:sulfur carrier protein
MPEILNIWINNQTTQLPVHATLADAVTHAQIKPPFAAAVNMKFVARAQYAQHELQDGDKIELISPITGG